MKRVFSRLWRGDMNKAESLAYTSVGRRPTYGVIPFNKAVGLASFSMLPLQGSKFCWLLRRALHYRASHPYGMAEDFIYSSDASECRPFRAGIFALAGELARC